MILITEIVAEIAKDTIEFPFDYFWALDSPYTIPKEAPSIMKVTVKVISFLLTAWPKGTPRLVQIMSSGSGALSTFVLNWV